MKTETAKEITNFVGWLVLAASVLQVPLFVVGAMASAYGRGSGLLALSWGLLALALGSAIALIQRAKLGYYLLYLSALVSLVGPRITFVPLVGRLLPRGPELDYYMMAINVAVALLIIWCHWSIVQEEEEPARKRNRAAAIAFLAMLVPGLIYWKTGLRTGNGEVARIAETPFVGEYLAPLQSSQPVLFRSSELLRKNHGTVVFRGYTTEQNVKEFAAAHDLKLMTNAAVRVKFLPIVKTWKLDPERFPVFSTADDLCYIGHVPKGSKLILQICHRPKDGRFTALAMGSPTAQSWTAEAEPSKQ